MNQMSRALVLLALASCAALTRKSRTPAEQNEFRDADTDLHAKIDTAKSTKNLSSWMEVIDRVARLDMRMTNDWAAQSCKTADPNYAAICDDNKRRSGQLQAAMDQVASASNWGSEVERLRGTIYAGVRLQQSSLVGAKPAWANVEANALAFADAVKKQGGVTGFTKQTRHGLCAVTTGDATYAGYVASDASKVTVTCELSAPAVAAQVGPNIWIGFPLTKKPGVLTYDEIDQAGFRSVYVEGAAHTIAAHEIVPPRSKKPAKGRAESPTSPTSPTSVTFEVDLGAVKKTLAESGDEVAGNVVLVDIRYEVRGETGKVIVRSNQSGDRAVEKEMATEALANGVVAVRWR